MRHQPARRPGSGQADTPGATEHRPKREPRTTKLYDRRGDKITQDAVERIRIE